MSVCVQRMQVNGLRPTARVLRGFGGGLVSGLVEITIGINIVGLALNIDAIVVECGLSDVDLLLGQPALNGDVVLVVRNGVVTLSPPEDLIKAITLGDEDLQGDVPKRLPVRVEGDITIEPGSITKVSVMVVGAKENGTYLVTALRHEEGNTWVAIPNTVLSGDEAQELEVSNLGRQPLTWKVGHVIARAEQCESRNIARVCQVTLGSIDEGDLDFSQVDVGDINPGEMAQLTDLLKRMAVCFSKNEADLGMTHLGEMRIEVTSDKPVYYRPYRLAYTERAKVREKVQALLDSGVIQESDSDYASPIILVPKKNGDVRMCVDYRALNRCTVKQRYPLPLVNDQLDKLAGKCYFSMLDLAQGYHQVPMHPDSVSKTAFITPDGHYEFLRVPFGLANAPAVFQRVIDKMLGGMQNESVLAYMDDLLVPSTSVQSGIAQLERVLQLVADAGLKLNLAKCSFLKGKLEYLGHEISGDGVRPGDKKIQAVSNFPTPGNVHGVRQFVGLASYFRKFVQNFAVMARPLTDLTKKDVPWCWGPLQIKAFEMLKERLVARPVLALYNAEAAIEVHTDACKLGLGGILLQQQPDGSWRPVAYFSRSTNPMEQVYHSYELETLALVETVKRFRVYLVGVHFKAVTDCSAVRATLLKRDLVPRVARWWIMLQEYDMELEYRPGTKMQHVHALSRNPVNICTVSMSQEDWFLTVKLKTTRHRK